MPTGKTLAELVTALRAEIGDSTNEAMGIDGVAGLQQTLRRVQETYYADYDWPHLIITRDEDVPAGERFFTFNEDVDYDRIFEAWVRDTNHWAPLKPGIDHCHYNESDPEEGDTDTPRRWAHYEEGQYELWPVPREATRVRFKCVRKLAPLVGNSDRCMLDSTLIVLTAAAELLARSKAEDATLKLQMATSHYNRLKGRAQKKRVFIMGGGTRTPGPQIRVPR